MLIEFKFTFSKAISYEDFFSRIIWVGGPKKHLGKKSVSYEDFFRKNARQKIAQKKKLEYSQPRISLAQKIPGDEEFSRAIFWITI